MRASLPTKDLNLVLSETPDVWRTLRGARVLITGATGFIGSWLVEAIQQANDALSADIRMVAISRSPDKARAVAPQVFNRADIEFISGDIRAPLPNGLGRIDACIHAATDVGSPIQRADPREIFDVCLDGSRMALNHARHGQSRYFLQLSSGAVYGRQPSSMVRVPEQYNGAPDCTDLSSAYGEGKRAAEWLACALASESGMALSIARIFALIGPNMPLDGSFAAGNFINDTLHARPIDVQGDGRTVRSYLYAADACIWLLRMLVNGTPKGQAYNLGSEQEITIGDLAHLIAQSGQPTSPVNIGTPAPDNAPPPPRYVPDTSKARTELGVREYTPLSLAIEKTIAWNQQSTRS